MVTGVGSPSIKSDIVAAGHQLVRFAPKAGPMTVPPITNATVAPMAVWMTANTRDRNRRRGRSSAHIAGILEHDSRHRDEPGHVTRSVRMTFEIPNHFPSSSALAQRLATADCRLQIED